jgi:hypothetical protein
MRVQKLSKNKMAKRDEPEPGGPAARHDERYHAGEFAAGGGDGGAAGFD